MKCYVDRCRAKVYSKGLCSSHYQRYSRHGSFDNQKGWKKGRARSHGIFVRNIKSEILEYRRKYSKLGNEIIHFGRPRKEVFDRDGGRCATCGTKRNLTIHHIDGKGRNSVRPNNVLTNLITLCRSCHGKIDGKKGKGIHHSHGRSNKPSRRRSRDPRGHSRNDS